MDSMTSNVQSIKRPLPHLRMSSVLRYCAVAGLAISLGGCSTDRVVTGSIVPENYRERHPVVIAERATSMDIYVSGAAMDRASRARLEEFGTNFRANGTGRIEILLPTGSASEAAAKAALPSIRQALAQGGATGFVSVGSYPADPMVAAPIHVSYVGIRGAVATKCGEWPADLASAGTVDGWSNRPYWNMGCATQNAMANQVADPRDLVEPRAMGNGDVEMRIRAIGKVRQGADPGTSWVIKTTPIGSIGGGG